MIFAYRIKRGRDMRITEKHSRYCRKYNFTGRKMPGLYIRKFPHFNADIIPEVGTGKGMTREGYDQANESNK